MLNFIFPLIVGGLIGFTVGAFFFIKEEDLIDSDVKKIDTVVNDVETTVKEDVTKVEEEVKSI